MKINENDNDYEQVVTPKICQNLNFFYFFRINMDFLFFRFIFVKFLKNLHISCNDDVAWSIMRAREEKLR